MGCSASHEAGPKRRQGKPRGGKPAKGKRSGTKHASSAQQRTAESAATQLVATPHDDKPCADDTVTADRPSPAVHAATDDADYSAASEVRAPKLGSSALGSDYADPHKSSVVASSAHTHHKRLASSASTTEGSRRGVPLHHRAAAQRKRAQPRPAHQRKARAAVVADMPPDKLLRVRRWVDDFCMAELAARPSQALPLSISLSHSTSVYASESASTLDDDGASSGTTGSSACHTNIIHINGSCVAADAPHETDIARDANPLRAVPDLPKSSWADDTADAGGRMAPQPRAGRPPHTRGWRRSEMPGAGGADEVLRQRESRGERRMRKEQRRSVFILSALAGGGAAAAREMGDDDVPEASEVV
jgi:hypothetical protein